MSILLCDILFAPNTSAIYILQSTITESRVGGVAGSHVSFFMFSMFRDIHCAPNTSVIYILYPTILSYTYTFLNVNLEFWNFHFVYDNEGEIYFHFSFFMSSLFCDILFAPNTSAIYILHPTITELRVHMFYFSCPTCSVIYIFHPTLLSYTFCSVIYFLHPTLPSYTFCTQQFRHIHETE